MAARASISDLREGNNSNQFVQEGGDGRQCVENKERLTLRIHRGRSGQRPPALTSVLLAKHGCPPGLGPALAGLASRDIVNRISDVTTPNVVSSADLPQITVTAAAAEPDCDLCRDGQDRLYQQQQQMHQSSSGLRENVSNASQAYKVLYMETPLCSCGQNSANGRAGKSGNKRSALEIFQTTGHKKNKTHGKFSGHRCLGTPRNTLGGLGGSGGGEDGADASGSANSGTKPLKLNRRNIKAQVKRFKMETKAAKTLGNWCSPSVSHLITFGNFNQFDLIKFDRYNRRRIHRLLDAVLHDVRDTGILPAMHPFGPIFRPLLAGLLQFRH